MTPTRSVADLRLGESGQIEGFADTEASLKLLEMGCLPGSQVELYGVAPLGCPVCVRVGACMLSLRRSEAAAILLQA